jgi:HK97 gp10 family phage protein
MSAPVTGVTFDLVLNRFPEVIAKTNARAKYSEHELKERIAEEARRRVAVDTGATRDSIEITDEGVEVGGAAIFLEHGTRNMAAEPFLGPACEAAKADVEIAFRGLFAGL